jgi:hypothetical protein
MTALSSNQTPVHAFSSIEEAQAAFPSPAEFRVALAEDVHSDAGRFNTLKPMDLLQACGVDVGNIDEFCLSQVCTDRRAMRAGRDMDWRYRYTYRISGKNRRSIRFQTEHGDGGVCEHIEGPYIYTRPFKKPRAKQA